MGKKWRFNDDEPEVDEQEVKCDDVTRVESSCGGCAVGERLVVDQDGSITAAITTTSPGPAVVSPPSSPPSPVTATDCLSPSMPELDSVIQQLMMTSHGGDVTTSTC